MTNKKLALCPYCGELLSKKAKTIDHIIPKQIGGCNCFSVLCCHDCNAELSKIERSAIASNGLSNLRAEMDESGYRIKSRRKADYIQVQKSLGLAGPATPVKFVHNNNTHKRELLFVKEPDDYIINRKEFYMLMPDETNIAEDKVVFVSMANKIVLGTCAWLWGDVFSKTAQASVLRKAMRCLKEPEILNLDSKDKHLVFEEQDEKDALDNEPNHTVLIARFEDSNKVIGLVNLFGRIESMVTVGDYDETFRDWLGDDGIVVISKTTVNQVQQMPWEEYKKFKRLK